MRMLVFLRRPGGGRILLGGTLVLLLAITALMGSRWTRFAPEEMDFDHQLTPPPGWLLWITTTAEGRRALIQSRQGSLPASLQASGIREDELLTALEGRGSNPEGALGAASRPVVLGSPAHALGTDRNGRDMVALLVAGARNCFLPGLAACAVALGFGIPLGLLAGYYEGRWRRLAQIFNGTLLSVPRMVLILVVICALQPDIYLTMTVLGVTLIPRVSELIATRVRILSRMGFILAAREGGISDFRILTRHLFWYQNRAVFFIQFSLIMAESILTETTLSYLQFGTKPPDVSWGNIIEGSRLTFFSGHITLPPA